MREDDWVFCGLILLQALGWVLHFNVLIFMLSEQLTLKYFCHSLGICFRCLLFHPNSTIYSQNRSWHLLILFTSLFGSLLVALNLGYKYLLGGWNWEGQHIQNNGMRWVICIYLYKWYAHKVELRSTALYICVLHSIVIVNSILAR